MELIGSWPFTIDILQVTEVAQRYDTVADWQLDKGKLTIYYVNLGDALHNWLLIHHEIDEACLCAMAGITQAQVDEFDENYERTRAPDDTDSEPGDQANAPYHFAHTAAEAMERTLALALGVIWGDYMEAIEEAFKRVRKARAKSRS